MDEPKIVKIEPPIDFVEADWTIGFDPAGDPSKDRKWTEKDFCLQLERIYWAEQWTMWKRLTFELKWLLGRYRDDEII